jgi:DNA-binding MarR family transcriptional regulator
VPAPTNPRSLPEGRQHRWTFLTNHALVLLLIADQPELRIVELAERSGLSRRAVQMILRDLVEGGYVRRTRIGRRNTYAVESTTPLRRVPRARVEDLLALLDR